MIGGDPPAHFIEQDLVAAGYDPGNRTYMVFEDFQGGAVAHCDVLCVAVTDEWDSAAMLHEFIHLFDVDHAKVTETVLHEDADVMSTPWRTWSVDQEFNNYYDPERAHGGVLHELYPHRRRANLATWPMLTAPVCCDVGYSNDLLTAQERTIEAAAPYAYPTGFGVSGGGWMQVTPPGPENLVSARYYDGRRSLTDERPVVGRRGAVGHPQAGGDAGAAVQVLRAAHDGGFRLGQVAADLVQRVRRGAVEQ